MCLASAGSATKPPAAIAPGTSALTRMLKRPKVLASSFTSIAMPGLGRRVMRQVARRTRMQRRQQQERAGLLAAISCRASSRARWKPASRLTACICAHVSVADGHGVIGLAPRRRGAMHEMRHSPDRRLRLRQQRVARGGIGEIADPWHRQIRPGRCFDGGGNRLRGSHRRTPCARPRPPAPAQWRGRCRSRRR